MVAGSSLTNIEELRLRDGAGASTSYICRKFKALMWVFFEQAAQPCFEVVRDTETGAQGGRLLANVGMQQRGQVVAVMGKGRRACGEGPQE